MVSTLGWCRWFPNAHAINGVVGFQIEFKVYVPRFYSDLIPPLHRIQTGGVGWGGAARQTNVAHGMGGHGVAAVLCTPASQSGGAPDSVKMEGIRGAGHWVKVGWPARPCGK
jgi:hypothetical protein